MLVRWRGAALALALLATPLAWADGEYDKLLEGFQAAQQKYYKDIQEKMQKAEKEGGPVEAVDMSDPPFMKEYRPKFEEFARKNEGQPAAIPALVWLVSSDRGQMGKAGEQAKAALSKLQDAHAGQAEIADSLPELQYAFWSVGEGPLVALYEKVMKENKSRDAQAAAMFNLAFTLYSAERGGGEAKAGESSGPAERARSLFRALAKDYKGTKGAESADGYIYEMDQLQIGMTAPDFEGQDADGKTIKLSQFRGRVVVIDFWGFW